MRGRFDFTQEILTAQKTEQVLFQLLAGASIGDVTDHDLLSNELIGPRMKRLSALLDTLAFSVCRLNN